MRYIIIIIIAKVKKLMLKAKTKEQKDGVKKVFINSSPDICTLNLHFPDNEGIIVYGYVTFDQMAAIVETLKSTNSTKRWKRKHNFG